MSEPDQVIDALCKKNTSFGRLFNGSVRIDTPELGEMETIFESEYGAQYGSLANFARLYAPNNASYVDETLDPDDPCASNAEIYVPERNHYIRSVPTTRGKRVYDPSIVSASGGQRRQDIVQFLNQSIKNQTFASLYFDAREGCLEYDDYYYCDDLMYDLGIKDIAKTILILNNSGDLGYKLMDVHTVKRIESVPSS